MATNYYKWIISVAVMINNIVIFGVIRSSGIFFVSLYRTYGTTKAEAAIISITMMGSMIGTSVLGGVIVHTFGYRKPIFVGSTMALIGVISSYFVNDPFYLIFTLGMTQGIGYGIVYTPNVAITSQYFKKDLAKANGLSMSGGCIGMLIVPVIIEYAVEKYGLRGSFLILAGIILQMYIASALILDPPSEHGKFENTAADNAEKTDKPVKSGDVQTIKRESAEGEQQQSLIQKLKFVTTKGCFIGIFLTHICFQTSSSLVGTTIPDVAINNGESPKLAVLLLSIASASDLFGRLTFGVLVDKGYLNIGILYGLILLAFGAVHIFMGIFESSPYAVLAVICGFYGLLFGMVLLLIPVTISHYYGRSYISLVFSILAIFSVVPIFCVAPLIALAYQMYSRYQVLYLAFGVFSTIVSLVWFFIGACEMRLLKSSQNILPGISL